MHRSLAMLFVLTLIGCSGGGSSTQTAPPQPVSPGASAKTTASFTITVPPKSAQAAIRKPRFVSANTASIVITLVSVNGVPFTGDPSTIATNLNVSNPACSLVSGALTCAVSASAFAGTDIYRVSTYDAVQTASAPATPIGNLLSTATVPVTVLAGHANTVTTPLVLNGVAQTVTATFAAADPHISGSTAAGYTIVGNQPYTLTFTSQDASGATIVGAGAPSLTSTNSALAVTPIDATTYTVQVKRYSATPLTVSVSPALGNAPSIAFTTVQEIWIANAALGNVAAYALFAGAPVQMSGDTIAAGLSAPAAVAFDPSGNLWVADSNNNTVTEYVPGTDTVIATISAGLLNPGGLAFDASGNVWVSQASSGGEITEYKSPLNGASVAATIGPIQAAGLAFDANGSLWAADAGNVRIVQYLPTNLVSPNATISSGLVAPAGIAFDASGKLWVSDTNNVDVMEYAPTNGAAPIAMIATNISSPLGIAFDASGNLYVANHGGNNVTAYVPANGAAPIVGDTIVFSAGRSGSGTNSVAISP
jgi:sugar lactone lactonase YvrE